MSGGSALANSRRNESPAAEERAFSYDIQSLHEIARRVNWNAIHGPKWMKAGRFRPGPGLGELHRGHGKHASTDFAKKRDD